MPRPSTETGRSVLMRQATSKGGRTMTSSKLYIGVTATYEGDLFRSREVPTKESHGDRYLYAMGPYRTVGDALKALAYTGMPEVGEK